MNVSQSPTPPPKTSGTGLAFSATVHCLTGCGIGEVLGMVIGTWLQRTNTATVVLAIVLAFVFGYALTGSLGLSLLIAGAAAFPVNLWLIRRGRHAHVHAHHEHH